MSPPPYDPGRDPATGLLNPVALRDYARELADATAAVLDVGDVPIVLGGDCSILLGTLLALLVGCLARSIADGGRRSPPRHSSSRGVT